MTPKETKALSYYRAYWKRKGFAPSLQELALHLKVSRQRAHALSSNLVEQGLLGRVKGIRERSYRPVEAVEAPHAH